ncbi:thrombospondin type 3 repeat-containing protein [Patescibacteria group bacterium]
MQLQTNQKTNTKIIISLILIVFSLYFIFADKKLFAQLELSQTLKGKILLQVEENGEAWYVFPSDLRRYFLGRPKDAFDIMRNLGIGISNSDIAQIPIAEANLLGQDDDNDGLSNALEDSLNTDKNNSDSDSDGYSDKEEILNHFNPLGNGALNKNKELQEKMAGFIIMQIEQHGEAWYVNPDDRKRYYLGRPLDAFSVMRSLGLGITNKNLALVEAYKVNIEYTPEKIIQKFTTIVKGKDSKRTYRDPEYGYSFEYPITWSLKKLEDQPFVTQITDAERDYILEKKGVISLHFFESGIETNVETFRIASKGESTTLSDEKKTINGHEVYENSYNHDLAYEKTINVQVSPTKFIQISMATAKSNNAYYEKVLDDLLHSLRLPEIE